MDFKTHDNSKRILSEYSWSFRRIPRNIYYLYTPYKKSQKEKGIQFLTSISCINFSINKIRNMTVKELSKIKELALIV